MINALLLTVILFTAVVCGLAIIGHLSTELKRCYYFGITIWSRILPPIAVGVFLVILATNIVEQEWALSHGWSLRNHMTFFEQVIFFILAPTLLTRFGNVAGATMLLYCIQQMLFSGGMLTQTSTGYMALLSALTIVSVIGDKMPWLAPVTNATAIKLREILLIGLSLFMLATFFICILQIYDFSRWVSAHFSIRPAPVMMMIGLCVVFLGWLSIALGLTRQLAIPLLCLPSLFAVAFLTAWPANALVIPFSLSLALALAAADRRQGERRIRRSTLSPSRAGYVYR